MSKTFVLGAGVSHSAGLPVAKNVLAAVADSEFKGTELDELHQFLEYLVPTFEKDIANYPDVEEFLTLLDVAESYSCFAKGRFLFPRRRLSRLRRVFLANLARFLWRAHEDMSDDHPIALLAKYFEPDDKVITFNYDLTVEYAIDEHSDMTYTYEPPVQKDHILILKPHGSIDWFSADEVDADGDEFRELMRDMTWYNGWSYDKAALSGRMPLIVPPVATKLIEHRDLQEIWNRMTTALISAQEVYVIGYSLPDADRLTRYVLRRAIRQMKEDQSVTVVNTDRKMREHFREQIHDRVRLTQQPFERWISRVHEDRSVDEVPFE